MSEQSTHDAITQTEPRHNAGYAILATLRNYGIDTVFGIPGTHNLEFYRHLDELQIKPVTTRHEQGASYGADGWSLTTGLPGVVITTSGPGLLNSLSGAATAYAESRPMIILSPGRPRGQEFRDIGALHETKNPTGAVGAIVGTSRRVNSALEAVEMIHNAFVSFKHSRPRPVHIEVPLDVLEEQAEFTEADLQARPLGSPQPAPVDDVARAARMLADAKKPLIVAGGGSLAAGESLLELAEMLEAPVITSVNGKGAIPEKHRLSLGADLRLTAAHEFCREADAMLIVGSKIGEAELWDGDIHPNGPVIRVDIMRDQMLTNMTPDLELPGNSAAVVPQLVAALKVTTEGQAPREERNLQPIFDRLDDEGRSIAPELAELNELIMEVLPDDTIIAGDSSQVTYMGTTTFYRAQKPNSLLYMATYATLGYGLPAAVGAKIAAPERPVVCLLGDGALMFAIQELMTAVQEELDIQVICVDNGGYGEIRANEEARNIAPTAVDLKQPNWVKLAEGFGATGFSATMETLGETVREAMGTKGPSLIHLTIGRDL
ncbi:thiamine pyrophosphate-binding protein [Kocuria sp. HSID16901]|uniref:thiamine pyrophosphate-binding protein n=1 Tax=Kocuria sp. HSID16901 TaxID=2419505 RepID=UPI0009E2AAFB|nr:thiamine pyrophosphate-binding protein [Kocuria sp. HSID16901]RUQ21787.1 thiamine pyrophosphate-binding protein [Kocuria sp. HSID16901]